MDVYAAGPFQPRHSPLVRAICMSWFQSVNFRGSLVGVHFVQLSSSEQPVHPATKPLHLRRTRQRLARRVHARLCWGMQRLYLQFS